MTLSRCVVLGGSSPFTAALIDAIAVRGSRIRPYELVLQGRDEYALELVAAYARCQLGGAGWRIQICVDMARAVRDAVIVLHQIRYGGLEGRGEGEALCNSLDVVADETLGPAALLTGMRTASDVVKTGELLAQHAPDAMVLNLTNPLSSTTNLLLDQGVRHCIGLCELPAVTVVQACTALGVSGDNVSFDYTGLNHRGFLSDVRVEGRDVLPELIDRRISIGGVTPETMVELNALPLKYFSMYGADRAPKPANRATALSGLRNRLLKQLQNSSSCSPPGLTERYLEWYPKSVVPVLEALGSAQPVDHVVNALCTDAADERCGLVIEGLAAISRSGVDFHVTTRDPEHSTVACWQRKFYNHERAFLEALRQPSIATCEAALALDPLIPNSALPRAVEELTRRIAL